MNSVQLLDAPIWFVRAEYHNDLADHFLNQGIVSMSWGIGPVKHDDSTEGFPIHPLRIYPDKDEPSADFTQAMLASQRGAETAMLLVKASEFE